MRYSAARMPRSSSDSKFTVALSRVRPCVAAAAIDNWIRGTRCVNRFGGNQDMPSNQAAAARGLAVAVSIAAVLGAFAGAANATSERVRNACEQDYFAFCNKFPEEGPAVRKCMDQHGPQLSKRCVDALIEAGEISRAEVEHRKAASNR
jgi:hypothetical protein